MELTGYFDPSKHCSAATARDPADTARTADTAIPKATFETPILASPFFEGSSRLNIVHAVD